MYQEATPVFLRNTAWVVRSGEANKFLIRFLGTVAHNKGFKAVKELRFTSFHWFQGLGVFPQNLDLILMARCTGLKQVLFTFHLSRLATPPHQEDVGEFLFTLKTVEEIVGFYGFEDIFKCQDLKNVIFDAISYWEYEDDMRWKPPRAPSRPRRLD